MPTPTLAELARAGTLGAATAPLTNATPPVSVPPEITLAMLARAGLLGPAGGQYTTPGQTPPITAAAEMPRAELTNAASRPSAGPPPGFGLPPPTVFRRDEIAPNFQAQLDRERDEGISRSAREMASVAGPGGGGQIPGAIVRGVSELGRMLSRSPIRTGAATAGAITAASTGETQQPDPTVPNFTPMSREEFFRNNRTARGSLGDAVSDAERRVSESQAYLDLVREGRRTAAQRMIDQAVARARQAHSEANSEAALRAEEDRLGRQYDTYVAGLGTQQQRYFAEREERERRERNRPFQERHPNAAAALPWVSAGIGLTLSAIARGRNIGNYNADVVDIARRWQTAVDAARTARSPQARELALTTAEGLQARAEQLIGRHPPAEGFMGRMGEALLPRSGGPAHRFEYGPAIGLAEGAQAYPLISDYATSTPGSPLRDYVMNSITDVPGLAGRIGQGILWGTAASKIGQGLGYIARPYQNMPNLGPQTEGLRRVAGPGPGGSSPPPTTGRPGPGLSDLLLGRTSPPPAAPPTASPPPPVVEPSRNLLGPPRQTATPPTPDQGPTGPTTTRQPTSRTPGTNEWPEVEGYRIVGTGNGRRYQSITNRNQFVSREELLNPHERPDRLTRGQ